MSEGITNTVRQALEDPIDAMCQALGDEVAAGYRDPQRAFEVTDGRWLSSCDNGQLYSFKSDIALPLPPETPVTIQIEGQEQIRGTLVALNDFDIVLHLYADLTENISRAKVSSEPWFIYGKLRKRLEAQAGEENSNVSLGAGLLGMEILTAGEDFDSAVRGKKRLEELKKKELVPNDAQLLALARCIGSRLHFIWGPPGTGKTSCLAQVVRTLAAEGERILLLAHSNAAVDVAMLRVAETFEGSQELQGGKILRIGIAQLPEMYKNETIMPEAIIERTKPELIARIKTLDKKNGSSRDR